jgi:hypothetical protein
MHINELNQFSEARVQIRAYLTYLLERNIPNNLPSITFDTIKTGVKSIRKEAPFVDAIYVLDSKGVQVSHTLGISKASERVDKGANRSNRAYYYTAVRQKRAILTDPYPSLLTNALCVSASYPIYDINNKLLYIVVIDVSLKEIVKIIYPKTLGKIFVNFSKVSYAAFSVALLSVVMLLFFKGMVILFDFGFPANDIDINKVFKATILITLALAIFDLVKTIFQEEVLGKHQKHESLQNRTMARFLGSIIIALAIESLMLVFKFAITDPTKLIYAVYIIGGVTLLLIGLAFYVKWTKESDEKV